MRIELFYDCLSPFSYLAFKVLRRYKPVWGFDLQLRPTLLAGVMVCLNNGLYFQSVIPSNELKMHLILLLLAAFLLRHFLIYL